MIMYPLYVFDVMSLKKLSDMMITRY